MYLIIVESPTKARTLSRFLGNEYQVKATMGHVRDLPKSKIGVDVTKKFKPEFVDVVKNKEAIAELTSLTKKATTVFIATDPDREGEAIAKHVFDLISETEKLKNPKDKLKRIVFHEITKEAVEHGIKNATRINEDLVSAQVARRVLDRLVGYKLSPVLWKKVRRGLSAGRVQTVAVKLIVEKEREVEKFKPEEYWEIASKVKSKKSKESSSFLIRLVKINDKTAQVHDETSAKKIEADLKKSLYRVIDVRKREVSKSPYPPFTTSTMSQAAARLYFWSAKRTMSIAQKLYEQGLITYHRTDSTNISVSALDKVRGYIVKEYGKEYLPSNVRIYKTKSKVAQEAHEAIRPTRVDSKIKIKDSRFANDENKLYQLIWRRFVACQMENSRFDETVIDVKASEDNSEDTYLLRSSGQVMKFDGWRILFNKENKDLQIPGVEINEELDLLDVFLDQKFTLPPARYNEAMLIKTLEKLGIGRPSTYAPIINTIQIRQYVEKIERRFKPTTVGFAVNDFLIKYFPDVFEYDFTAKMEDNLDNIANGEVEWTGVIGNFWKPFDKKVIKVEKESERVKIPVEKIGRKCTKCKKGDLVIRIGRFGKFISCDRFPECTYTEKLIVKLNIKCPDCKKGEVIIKTTSKKRKFYGCSRYPKCKWASWKKPVDEIKKESPAAS